MVDVLFNHISQVNKRSSQVVITEYGVEILARVIIMCQINDPSTKPNSHIKNFKMFPINKHRFQLNPLI